MPAAAQPPTVPGRSCDGCTMCCKLLPVAALEKPAQAWCTHCDIGKGCRVYAERPDDCRTFYCGWMLDASFGDPWRPADSRMVVMFRERQIIVAVDKALARDWRREPFFSHLRAMARQAIPVQGDVLVTNGAEVWRVGPDGETKVG